MHWLPALTILFLQAPGTGKQPVLPPTAGPELERIMSEQNLEPRLGPGWTFGDVSITADSISVEMLHLGEKAAVLILKRPPDGDTPQPGTWFSRRVEVLTGTTPRIEAALAEIAASLDRGFAASPWMHRAAGDLPRPFMRSKVVPCAFCRPVTRQWPFHYTRHPWIPLCLGASIIAVLGLGVFFGLRRSGRFGGILP